MKELLRRLVPFELKRGTSLISIVAALVIAGLLAKLGDLILTFAIDESSKFLPVIGEKFVAFLLFKFEINVLTVVLVFVTFLLLLFPIYRYIDRLLLRERKQELIYEETFLHGAGWNLNYWGTTNPQKTNRIENSQMIFEAINAEVLNGNGFFGAYYDLRSGIYQGNTYRVVCSVKSLDRASMGFQLWLHDTTGNPQEVDGKAILIHPLVPTTPSEKGEQVQVDFRATSTNALRIHLHCRGGSGKIVVDNVRVYKI